ncbi:hypothetical protein JMG10_41330 [Nostoc ellipsosporum NOK]|nr:hypothetical protein [Nostoc ellipsosporum NOK]
MAIDDRKDSGARNSFAGKHCGIRRGDARCLFQLDDKRVFAVADVHRHNAATGGGRQTALVPFRKRPGAEAMAIALPMPR